MNRESLWTQAGLVKDTEALARELAFIEAILIHAIEFQQHYGRHPSALDLQQELHRTPPTP